MKISTIAAGDETGKLSQFSNLSLWNKDVEQLNDYHLLGYYTQAKNNLGTAVALELMRELKGECLYMLMLGDLPSCAIIDWRPPINDLVAPNLLVFMQALPFNERACILVALSEGKPIGDLMNLDWQAAKLMPWTPFSRDVMNRIPQRLGCRFVFWSENVLGNPQALIHLQDSIHDALDVTWSEFASIASNLLRFEHFAHTEIESLLNKNKPASL